VKPPHIALAWGASWSRFDRHPGESFVEFSMRTRTAVAAVLSLLIPRLFATMSGHVLALLVFDARLGLRGDTPVNQIGFLDVHKESPFAPFK